MKFELLILMFSAFTRAQVPVTYETTAENPFGKINPEASKEVTDYAPLIGVCYCISTMRNPDKTWGESQKIR